ncbi:MAG TPA: ABC transporter permease [Candidatus Polarisedimenticolia bacterium]|nr:ABC transporter permease [Candidatus Polarisedimenticolia bacterium]
MTPGPDLAGFLTLLRRETYRFIVLPNQTIVPPLVSAVLYVLIFGYAIGSRIAEVGGAPYIVYIFPGLVMMNAINGAYANTTTSLFIARNELFIQDLLVSPLSHWEMVLAYTLGGAARGVLVGAATLLVGWGILVVHVHSVAATLFFLAVSSLAFAALGNIVGLWAERWDDVAICLNYVVTPLVFLGGVFYSIEMLPGGWREASRLNPIFFLVSGFRHGILGAADAKPALCAAVGTALFGVLFAAAVALFRKGYKLKA